MTIQECYNKLGGSLEQAEKRLPSINLIKKFVAKFPDDTSFSELCFAMQNGDAKAAFRAAHTLKGVCANLNFDRLFSSAEKLTELLRDKTDTIPEKAFAMLEDVKTDYELTVDAIRAYLASDDEQP